MIITPGLVFGSREQVTPTKLNNLLDLATVTGLNASNFGGGNVNPVLYGNTAPPLQRGALWYNTTAGNEGLFWAFLSASNASISRWLCATPRREMVGWAQTSFSANTPCWVGRQGSADLGHHYVTYDGTVLPLIWPSTNETGPHPALIIPSESVSASGPVTCIWAGFAQALMGNSPLGNDGREIWVNRAGPTTFRDDAFTAQAMPVGTGTLVTGSAIISAPVVLWGRPSHEKRV